MKIYSELKTLLGIVTARGRAANSELHEFRTKVDEADFLFGPEVMTYLEEIYKHAIDLGMWSNQYRDYSEAPYPPDYDHTKVVERKTQEFLCITSQYGPALAKFRPYFDMTR